MIRNLIASLMDIKSDPFERSPESAGHFLWMKEKSWLLPVFARPFATFQRSLKEFPPRQTGSGVGAATLMRAD